MSQYNFPTGPNDEKSNPFEKKFLAKHKKKKGKKSKVSPAAAKRVLLKKKGMK